MRSSTAAAAIWRASFFAWAYVVHCEGLRVDSLGSGSVCILFLEGLPNIFPGAVHLKVLRH